MRLRVNGINQSEIERLLIKAKRLLNEIGNNRGVRVRDVSYSSAQMTNFVKLGLLKIVATEREKREIPQRSRYGRYPDLSLREIETGNIIEDIQNCRVGYTYVAKDTKTVDGVYNVYALTFGSIEEIKYEIKRQLQLIYNDI